MTRHWLLLLGLAPLLGCSVRELGDLPAGPTVNECADDADCGPAGHCVSNRCEALEGEFSTVLFEVSAPGSSTSDDFAGLSFLATRTDVPTTSGELGLELGDVSEVVGTVVAPFLGRPGCEYDFSQAPLRIRFSPTERVLGLPATTYAARGIALAGCAPDDPACLRTATFGLRVPPGEYEVYVRSDPSADQAPGASFACEIVPQLYRRIQIDAAQVELPLELPARSTLALRVQSALDGDVPQLEGWTLDLLDPVSGRALSTANELTGHTVVDGIAEYVAEVRYSSVLDDPAIAGVELVRLAPPEGVVAPAVLMERASLELFADAAVINHLVPLPTPIQLEGRVETEGAEPAPATVTLVATALDDLPQGTLASYQRTVETDDEGRFLVELLPGSYRVLAVPPIETGLAVFDAPWQVAAEPAFQAGRTIELVDSSRLVGSVLSPAGRAVAGASVLAVSSPSNANVGVLQGALGEAPFVPRATTVASDEHGEFELLADPPWVDVSVRPDASTGFAWMVRPNVRVLVPENVNLGDMVLPLPLAYRGTVTVLGGIPLPGALIRAYILLGPDGYTSSRDDTDNPAEAVAQVAEARADERGQFELLVPRSLWEPLTGR
jgi:hypothetical protein